MPFDTGSLIGILCNLGLFLGLAIFIGAVFLLMRRARWIKFGVDSGYLCDRCKYNSPRYCSLPDRPNATRCPDFKSSV